MFRPIFIFALLCAALLAGCAGVHSSSFKRAGAPGLNGDGELRNAANPNAPFTSPEQRPSLHQRAAVLDVGAVPECDAAQLGLFESGARSNGEHHLIRLAFVNNGEACRLSGFPSVTLLRADGSVVGTVRLERVSDAVMAAGIAPTTETAREEPTPSGPILLPGHGEAAFELGWTAGPACEQVARIAVGAPGATRSVMLARTLSVCENRILITAVALPE